MKVSVYEVPNVVSGQQVGAFLMQYGELVEIYLKKKLGEWKYHLLLSSDHFNKIANWITINGRRVAVIVSGSKLSCWHCGETGHLSAAYPAKETRSQKDKPLFSKKMPATTKYRIMEDGCKRR